ncbi:MAG: DUF3828 domain-containing protein [Acidobacteria bacterium]|nr:DUF3828 domain-containing protein [Acidobacteriota bacterium]
MRKVAVLAVVFALNCMQTGAQKLPSNVADAAIFVRKFYKWYVPIAKKSKVRPAEIALQERASSFDPKLATALEEDFRAQEKAKEIVGIDWDPFLSGQDTCDSYPLSTPTAKINSVLVPVFCEQEGKLSAKPVVTAEVSYRRGQWVFTNFVYPQDDLMALLMQLKQEREKH